MREIERRLKQLEQAKGAVNWLTMSIEKQPNAEQKKEIERAIANNDLLFVFIGKGDQCWMAGLSTPPWERPPPTWSDYY